MRRRRKLVYRSPAPTGRPYCDSMTAMTRMLLITIAVVVGLAAATDAHFVLVSPAASMVQNRLGDPQKMAPCGGVSANAGRGTPANPGVASGAVTDIKGGGTVHLLLHETVFHPGRTLPIRSGCEPLTPVSMTATTTEELPVVICQASGAPMFHKEIWPQNSGSLV